MQRLYRRIGKDDFELMSGDESEQFRSAPTIEHAVFEYRPERDALVSLNMVLECEIPWRAIETGALHIHGADRG
jgi:hypothetical protein